MEKSIESIWKEGFLNNEAFIAPKLINLYNKKSEHIVDKFTRMFKINLIAIVGGSFLIFGMTWLVKIPYMGVGMFILCNALAVINYKLMKGIETIDKSANSYEYLKGFDSWLREMISLNKSFARFFYPLIFLSLIAGFWFGPFGGDIPGDEWMAALATRFPDWYLVFGVPLYLVLGLTAFLLLLSFAAARIYEWDLNIVYGRVIKKLNEIMADMEELQDH